MKRPYLLCTLLLANFLVAGCSEPTTGIVEGTITVDGERHDGYIGFTATDGKTGPVGVEFVDGKYHAEVPLGEMGVEIRIPVVVGQQKLYNTPDSPIRDVQDELLPARYHDESELLHTVVPGEATKDFELTLKRKRK